MRIERVDDVPLLGHQIQESGLANMLDVHFPDHGHWQGLSGGTVAVGWLLYILSEADHRLSYVEKWAEERLWSLRGTLNSARLRSLDFSDDRLGNLLDRYADDESWDAFESAFNSQLLKAYDVSLLSESGCRQVRLDSVNVSSYRESGELFKQGYNKHKRPDMPHLKAMVATLDPMALPLAVELVDGRTSDDETYLPVVEKLRGSVGKGGTLFVGDSKLGSRRNRVCLIQDGDYYLCPLNRKQCTLSQLYKHLDDQPAELQKIFESPEASRQVAYFYEVSHRMTDESTELEWEERRVIVYSPAYGEKHKRSLYERLDKAEEKLKNLVIPEKGRRRPKTLTDLHARSAAIIKHYNLEGLFELKLEEHVQQKHVQRYGNRPAEIREESQLGITVTRNQIAIKQHISRLGWQVYASNISPELMDTAQLVITYRNEYRIEQLFHYLANRVTNLIPVYLKKDQRVKGLIRLLLLALKFSTLFQHRLRQCLAAKKETLTHLYPGNKGRQTQLPTARRTLQAFQNISILVMETDNKLSVQMTDLKPIQLKILKILGQEHIYQRLIELLNTSFRLRET